MTIITNNNSSEQIYMTPEQSCMKLKPSIHDPNATAHSYWCAVVTKLNGEKRLVADFEHNVFPAACVDQIHNTAFTNTSNTGTRGFGCIALTADTTQTINSAQTALTGEITTNGLARTDAVTKTHVTGTNTSLIEHTFTLSGTQTDITRAALFNIATAPVSGTMGPFAAFASSTGSMSTGETLKVSITITTS